MDESNTPQGQDNTTEHGDERENSSTLSDGTLSKTKSPTTPSKGCHPYHYQQSSQPWWKRLNWMLIVEVMVFIVAIKVARIYSDQLKQMIEANKITRSGLESGQRAFVAFREVESRRTSIRSKSQTTVEWVFRAKVENAGATPAENAINRFNAGDLADEPTKEQFKGAPFTRAPSIAINPKGEQWLGPLTKPESFIPLNKPSANMQTTITTQRKFFWGWIVYRDVFPWTKTRLTEFCQEVSGVSYPMPLTANSNFTFVFNNCQEHNCTDEYCSDYSTIIAMLPKE